MKSLIEFKDVYFSYNNVDVLKNINLKVCKGDFLYIYGDNGSGKTTLLKGLLGLKKPSRGEIIIQDELKRNQIGYIPQQKIIRRDFPASVEEIVISGRLSSKSTMIGYGDIDKKIAHENMEKLNISNLKDKAFKNLSGGQQQRVLLARALCATKSVLVLDEPSSGLDPLSRDELYRLLGDLNSREDISIIIVTHDRDNIMGENSRIMNIEDQTLISFEEEN